MRKLVQNGGVFCFSSFFFFSQTKPTDPLHADKDASCMIHTHLFVFTKKNNYKLFTSKTKNKK